MLKGIRYSNGENVNTASDTASISFPTKRWAAAACFARLANIGTERSVIDNSKASDGSAFPRRYTVLSLVIHLLSPINHITSDIVIAPVNSEKISVSSVILLPLGNFASSVMPLFENRRFITAASSVIGSITKSVLAAVFPFSKKAKTAEQTRASAIKTGLCTIAVISITDRKYIAAVTGCVLSIVAP